MESLFNQFVTLWVVIDPIGTIPVFVAVTVAMNTQERRRAALLATITAVGVLLFFLVLGQLLVDALEISLPAFQIAGSIILFLFALTMIFGDSKPEAELEAISSDEGAIGPEENPGGSDQRAVATQRKESPAIFPLAVPSLASPGAMLAVVLLTDNNRYSVIEQAETAAVMVLVCLVAYLLMLAAGPIQRVIGMNGAAVISRVMGIILASVAVDNIIDAVLNIVSNFPA